MPSGVRQFGGFTGTVASAQSPGFSMWRHLPSYQTVGKSFLGGLLGLGPGVSAGLAAYSIFPPAAFGGRPAAVGARDVPGSARSAFAGRREDGGAAAASPDRPLDLRSHSAGPDPASRMGLFGGRLRFGSHDEL